MSYILEALRKSEIERRAGRTPELANAASFVVESDSRFGRVGVAAGAAIFLAAGVGLGWWQPWQPKMSATVLVPPAAVTPLAPPRVTTVAATVPVAVLPSVAPAPEVIATGSEAAPSAAAPISSVAGPVPEAPPATDKRDKRIATGGRVDRPPRVMQAAVPAPAWSAPSKAPARIDPPSTASLPARTATVGASAAANTNDPALADAAQSTGGIVKLEELPVNVRNALPKISVGGFAGADDPQDRFAVVNGQIVREGEELSPGLRVEEIGAAGVIMGYKGHRFRPAP